MGCSNSGTAKDHHPNLLQVKVMLSAPNPLRIPVATEVVPGQRAYAPLYPPAIIRVRESPRCRGLLYV
jgi:transposase